MSRNDGRKGIHSYLTDGTILAEQVVHILTANLIGKVAYEEDPVDLRRQTLGILKTICDQDKRTRQTFVEDMMRSQPQVYWPTRLIQRV